jgi:hypothetical protein
VTWTHETSFSASPFRGPRYGLGGRLPPPTFRGGVFKHRVEMIHADEPEFFRSPLMIGSNTRRAAAYAAVDDDDGFSSDRVMDMMMIDKKADRICLRLAIVFNANDYCVVVERILGARLEGDDSRLLKHPLGRHSKAELTDNGPLRGLLQAREAISIYAGFQRPASFRLQSK